MSHYRPLIPISSLLAASGDTFDISSSAKMMEDAGEDLLRAKPSPVTTFFRRIGQVTVVDAGPF